MRRVVPAVLLLTSLLGGCTSGSPDAQDAQASGTGPDEPALGLPDYEGRGGVALQGCAGLGSREAGERRSLLVGFRVRATEEVRIEQVLVDAATHGFEYVERFHALDVDPDAPAVVAYDGRRPSTERFVDASTTRPIGDPADTRAGLAAVREAWESRRGGPGRSVPPGDHYLFLRSYLDYPVGSDPDLQGLALRWSEAGGAPDRLLDVGRLSLRAPRCGA